MAAPFQMFVGDRPPNIEVEQSVNGKVGITVEEGWVSLDAADAVKFAQAILSHALASDRDATWKAALGL